LDTLKALIIKSKSSTKPIEAKACDDAIFELRESEVDTVVPGTQIAWMHNSV
jgi:hypothetical protein